MLPVLRSPLKPLSIFSYHNLSIIFNPRTNNRYYLLLAFLCFFSSSQSESTIQSESILSSSSSSSCFFFFFPDNFDLSKSIATDFTITGDSAFFFEEESRICSLTFSLCEVGFCCGKINHVVIKNSEGI
jgi:hypothetical protein